MDKAGWLKNVGNSIAKDDALDSSSKERALSEVVRNYEVLLGYGKSIAERGVVADIDVVGDRDLAIWKAIELGKCDSDIADREPGADDAFRAVSHFAEAYGMDSAVSMFGSPKHMSVYMLNTFGKDGIASLVPEAEKEQRTVGDMRRERTLDDEPGADVDGDDYSFE